MNKVMLILTLISAGVMVIFLIVNGVRTARGGESSKLYVRIIHLAGIAATIFNGIRVMFIYDDSRGTMLAANIIVLFSLLVSFSRSERGVQEIADDEDE